MDKLTEQYFKARINEIKEKLEEKRYLNEEKIPADMDLLNQEMEKVPELKKLLNMPAKELAKDDELKDYIYLLDEILPQKFENDTLLKAIQLCVGSLEGQCFFSKNSKNILRGFMAYATDENNCVKQLKMFSFNKKGDMTFSADLKKFLKELCENHKFVSWSALNVNRVNKSYTLEANRLKQEGYSIFIKQSKKTTRYFVSKKCSEDELKNIAEDFN